MRFPILAVGSKTNGSTVRLTAASTQSVWISTHSSAKTMNVWRSRSAKICERATWIFSMSLTSDDISFPVCCFWKNAGD